MSLVLELLLGPGHAPDVARNDADQPSAGEDHPECTHAAHSVTFPSSRSKRYTRRWPQGVTSTGEGGILNDSFYLGAARPGQPEWGISVRGSRGSSSPPERSGGG